jgi:ADP-heptose:LPS heptosyltransferase
MEINKKILLVQLYSNGDCLYATAVARQIKQDFTNCYLTWAIASFCKNIIANNPYIDEVLEVASVAKNDIAALRRYKKIVAKQKAEGIYDEVFFIHNGDTNQAYYDGCIRSSILKAYTSPIIVPITPVLHLLDDEITKAKKFAHQYNLSAFNNVILFEFAPQSGQSTITKGLAISIAEAIVADFKTAVILSSANKINHINKAIIDGSSLTIRETAALTHYCTFLLGTSSGITWVSTSDAAKLLPMVQLFKPYTRFENPISRDFQRFGISTEKVIELLVLDQDKIVNCVGLALKDFTAAKIKYNQPIPLHFKTTRNIVYNLLCYLEFGAIANHIKVNREVYGNNFSFFKEIIIGFLEFPFKLVMNLITKRIKTK